ncbi:uncharacterized protein LOC135818865 [Sycon ciliatum]|uniref:uncharacterized protein LOC135818865 n=1 Tax=Sycon ciliatum TaxID=27933 RepID=UPI0031F6CACC
MASIMRYSDAAIILCAMLLIGCTAHPLHNQRRIETSLVGNDTLSTSSGHTMAYSDRTGESVENVSAENAGSGGIFGDDPSLDGESIPDSDKVEHHRTARSISNVPAATDATWPDGKVLFKLEDYSHIKLSIVKRFYNTFRAAIRHIEERSCVRFYRHVNAAAQGNTYAIIQLQPNSIDCFTPVGKQQGVMYMHVGEPCLTEVGYMVHQLLHLAGLYHMHQRSDRDQYVRIFWQNILPVGMQYFSKYSTPEPGSIPDNMRYDYGSIMHYGKSTYGTNQTHAITMLPRQQGIKIGQRKAMSQIDINILNALYQGECTFVNKTRSVQKYIQFEQRISIALPNRRWLRCENSWSGLCQRRPCQQLLHPIASRYGNCRASEFYLRQVSGSSSNAEEILRNGDQVYLMVRQSVLPAGQQPFPLQCRRSRYGEFACKPVEHGPGTALIVHALKATSSRELISEESEIALCFNLHDHYWCFYCPNFDISLTHNCEPRICDNGPDNCIINDPDAPVLIPMTIRQWRNHEHPNAVQYKRTISLRRGHGRWLGVHRYFHCSNSSCSTELTPQCLRGQTSSTPPVAGQTYSSQICDEGVFQFMPENDVMPDDGLLRYEDTVSLVTARGQRKSLLCPSVNASCYFGSCPSNAKQCDASTFIVRQSAGFHLTNDDGKPVPSDDRVALCREASVQPLQYDLCLSCGRDSSSSAERLPCKLVRAKKQDRNAFHASNFFVSQWRLLLS